MTKISKELLWLAPYLQRVSHMVPLENLKSITAYQVPLNKHVGQYAALTRKANNKTYTLALCVSEHSTGTLESGGFVYVKQLSFPYAFFMDTVAHELAHLRHWEHDIKHLRLQLKIMWQFTQVMKDERIKDTWERIKTLKASTPQSKP